VSLNPRETAPEPAGACPDQERLRQFLDGTSPEAERRSIAAHLETCASCQAQLDRWTDDPAIVAAASRPHDEPAIAVGGALDHALSELKRDLRAQGQGNRAKESPGSIQDTTLPVEERGASHIAPLDFLAPSDRAGSLGRLGPYEVLGRIGQGGMGIVLKAYDTPLKRIVAVKVLMPALAGNAVAKRRFEREAQAAAAVCHEHVVTIHAVDEAAGLPYLVMQLIAGQSLQQKLSRDGPLGLKETLRIGMQIASGLAAAHAQGLVHRDIKPANILLENGVARVKITDFGLARAIDDTSLSQSGIVAGTPTYMSPEQARGEPIDHRTDLFSLGSVLYAMCTGQAPFRAESTVAILRKVSDEPPRPVRALNPDVPEWLAQTIAKLMAKDPAERYQTAAEVADLLARRLAAVQQPAALEPTATLLPVPPLRVDRHGNRMTLASLVAVIVALGALAVWWVVHSRPAPDTQASSAPIRAAATQPAPTAATPEKVTRPTAAAEIQAAKSADQMAAGAEASRRGDAVQAVVHYTNAVQLDPTSTGPLLARAGEYIGDRFKNWPGAIADTTEAIRIDPRSAEAYAVRAVAEERSGDHHRAIADANEALRIEPTQRYAYAARGSAYNSLREWDRAIADLDEALRQTPNASWLLAIRSWAYRSKGDLDHALADINRAIELDPAVADFWLRRGQIRARKNDFVHALDDLNESLRKGSATDRPALLRERSEVQSSLHKFDAAIADLTEAIQLDPKNVDGLLKRARPYARNEIENWQGAIADTTAILRIDARNVAAYERRCYAYMRAGDAHRAIADANAMLKIDPNNAAAYSHRGSAYLGLREWDRSIADFDTFLARDPNAAWPVFLRGQAYQGKGDLERALADFSRAIELDRNTNHFWIGRGRIRALKGDAQGAIDDLSAATRVGNELDKHYSYLARGDLNATLIRFDAAIADFTEAIRLKGMNTPFQEAAPYNARANAYLAWGESDRALDDLNTAIRIDPKNASSYYNRSLAHARKSQWEQALEDLDEGRRVAGADMFWAGGCIQGRGDCLAMLGRTEQAQAAYDECIKLDPGRAAPVMVTSAWFLDRARGDYAAALKKLDEAAKTGMLIQFLDRGLIYARLGRADEALADFDEVMKRLKSRPEWFAVADYFPRWLALLLGRGEAYMRKGEFDRALAECDAAVKFAPRSAEAHLLRAEVHSKRGNSDLAEADRQEAKRLTPDPMLALPRPKDSGNANG
jgi:serine/threonine protein kinase/Tfp pilus assembly protein PilF